MDPAWKDIRQTDIVIPIMGQTGAGRSSFINSLLGHIGDRRSVKVGHHLSSCTSEVQSIAIDGFDRSLGVLFLNLPEGSRVVVVDTPGFEEDTVRDFKILKDIVGWLQESLKRKMVLGGVIYLHDISKDRYDSRVDCRQLEHLSKLCRAVTFDKIVMVTSKWCRQGVRDFGRREKELREVHWKGLIQRGVSVMRLDDPNGEGAGAWKVVIHVLKKDVRLNG